MQVSPYVNSAVEGYNVCIFSHGQEAQKCYTMQGNAERGEQVCLAYKANLPPTSVTCQGINSHSVSEIFARIDVLKEQGWEHDVTMSLFQINEEVAIKNSAA